MARCNASSLVMQVARPAAARDRLVQNRSPLHLFHILPRIADMEAPGNRPEPSSGSSSPTIMRKSVVFPGAIRGTRPTFSPGFN